MSRADYDEEFTRWLRWRNVETPCPTCKGSGLRGYSNTSTWRGGIGGCAITNDVCDQCWGSGDAVRHGSDLRAMRAGEEQRVAERAVNLLADRAGALLITLHPTIMAIVAELEKLARSRKERPPYFHDLCTALATTLRKGVEDRINRELGPTR